jgi:surface antigen
MAIGLTSCKTTNETVGAVVGGIGGAAASYGITRALGGDSTTAAIASVAGGLAGAYIGGEIGRALDEEDRKKAQAASTKAVTDGSTGQTVQWKSDKNPNVYGRTKVVDTGKVTNKPGSSQPTVTWQRSRQQEPITAAPAQSEPESAPASAAKPASKNTTTQPAPATSKPKPVQTASVEPADNKTCKKIDEVAYINGKETRQQRVFCQTASGGWTPVSV